MSIEVPAAFGFPAAQRSHLVGIGEYTTPWQKEWRWRSPQGVESVVLFALDQFCLIGYSLPLDRGRRARVALHGDGLIRAGDNHQEHREHFAVAEVVLEETLGQGREYDSDPAMQKKSGITAARRQGAQARARNRRASCMSSHMRTSMVGMPRSAEYCR